MTAVYRDPAEAWDNPLTEPPQQPSGFFQALARVDAELAARGPFHAVLTQHHTVTESLALADVVIACSCTPDTPRDLTQWFAHVLPLITTVSAASPGAAVGETAGGEPAVSHPTQ